MTALVPHTGPGSSREPVGRCPAVAREAAVALEQEVGAGARKCDGPCSAWECCPPGAGRGEIMNTIGPTATRRRRAVASPNLPSSRASSVLAGTFLAGSGPLGQPGGAASDHPVRWLIGLLAVVALGWLCWVVSGFGRDAAMDPGTPGDGGDAHRLAQSDRLRDASRRSGRSVGRQARQISAGPRGSFGPAGTRGASSEPVGPEDDERFMRQLGEQLERRRAQRQRDQEDGTDAGGTP